MPSTLTPTAFTLYRWSNPATTAVYPFLALATDQSALLSFGDHDIGFDLRLTAETAHWLAHDFEQTGEELLLEISTVRSLLDTTFAGGAEFGLLTFDKQLEPCRLQLSLHTQAAADEGPEYVLQGLGVYQRLHRDSDSFGPVAVSERAMLDVYVATFTDLAARCAPLVREPPPPRYRPRAAKKVSN